MRKRRHALVWSDVPWHHAPCDNTGGQLQPWSRWSTESYHHHRAWLRFSSNELQKDILLVMEGYSRFWELQKTKIVVWMGFGGFQNFKRPRLLSVKCFKGFENFKKTKIVVWVWEGFSRGCVLGRSSQCKRHNSSANTQYTGLKTLQYNLCAALIWCIWYTLK